MSTIALLFQGPSVTGTINWSGARFEGCWSADGAEGGWLVVREFSAFKGVSMLTVGCVPGLEKF